LQEQRNRQTNSKTMKKGILPGRTDFYAGKTGEFQGDTQHTQIQESGEESPIIFFDVVVAACVPGFGNPEDSPDTKYDYWIGKGLTIPWPRITTDLKYFKNLTTRKTDYKGDPLTNNKDEFVHQNALIYGYNTFLSLPLKFKPLPDRVNIVMTRRKGVEYSKLVDEWPNVCWVSSFQDALEFAQSLHCPNIFVIGGSQVYAEAMEHKGFRTLFMTRVLYSSDPHINFACDCKFPSLDFTKYIGEARSHTSDEWTHIEYPPHTLESGREEENPTFMGENGMSFRMERWVKLPDV